MNNQTNEFSFWNWYGKPVLLSLAAMTVSFGAFYIYIVWAVI